MLRPAHVLTFLFLLLAGCGGSLQGPPDFQQVFSVVDQPCAASKLVSHCTAHVLVVNRGGEGIGHATVLVPIQTTAASAARTVASVRCGRSIPDTPAGGFADLTCDFDLPGGKTASTYPTLDIDFSAGTGSSSSGGDLGGLGTIGLATIAGVLAVFAFVMAVGGRRGRLTRAITPTPESRSHGVDEEDDGDW
jgi:hypothetical protein